MSEDNGNGKDKPNLTLLNGGAPPDPKPQEEVPPQAREVMRQVALQCRQLISAFYPEVFATNPTVVDEAAARAGGDIMSLQPLLAVLQDPDARETHAFVRVGVSRPSPLANVPDEEPIWIEGPSDLGKCRTADDMFATLTIISLATSDSARALAYVNGFRFRFGTSPERVVQRR